MILSLLLLSLTVYILLRRKSESLLFNPGIKSMVFYRDYLLLTMLPYLYYTYDNRYKSHYILTQLKDETSFNYAAIAATTFILTFLLSYKIFLPVFNSFTSKFQQSINYKLLVYILSCLSFISFIIIIIVSYKYQTGIFFTSASGHVEASETRHLLSQGSGFLKLNKIFIKSWVPITSYIFLYLYLKQRIEFSKTNTFMMYLSILNGILASIFFLEKAILFIYVFGFIGIYTYSGRSLKKQHMPLAVIFAILSIAAMYLVTYGNRVDGLSYLYNIIIHRTATQSVGSVMAFDYFNQFEFKGMAGVSNFWAALTHSNFSSPYSDIIKYYDSENASISGAMSSFAAGEAYGLFGILGIFFSGFIVSFYLAFFESSKNSNFLSILFVGFYAIYFSQPIVASSFYSFVWPIGFIYDLIPFLLIIILCSKNLRKNEND